MGWLNFLSRRSAADDLKAQAYDQTVAANPPIRGTYPVAGNGASILEKFQKTYPHLRDAHFNGISAPLPAVPRLLERPSTAPTHRSPEGPTRPKSQSANSVKPLPPPKKRHGPYKLPSKIANEPNDDIANNKSIYSVPSPTFVRDRNSSIFSGDSSSTRRHVDLLDAQSFIKPADFYGRVKATGTKDYDEDVADRNICENGSTFNPGQALELYSRNFALGTQSDAKEVDRPWSSRKRHSMGSGLRRKPTSSDFHSSLHKTKSSQASEGNENKDEARPTRKEHRRRSLHSYVPPSSADTSADSLSASIGKKVEETESNSFPDYLRERARAAAFEGLQRDFAADLETKSTRSSRRVRDIPVYEQDSDSDIFYYERNDSKQAVPTEVDQYQLAKDRCRRKTMSNASSSITVEPPFKRDSLQAFQSPGSFEPTAESHLPKVEDGLRRKKNHNSSRRRFETHLDFHDSFYDLPSLQPLEAPKLKSSHSRPNSRDELNHRDRKRSIVSTSGKSVNRSEIVDAVPERGSSIRRWSLTSETAGSTLSSNPFRPQSGHTTNTSVDLAPRVPLLKTVESGDNSLVPDIQPKVDIQESSYNKVDPELLAGSLLKSSRHQPSIDFVIDEDASSIDSFDATRRSADEFEKDLLFQGYGLEGSQLPGLPGLFDAAIPRTKSTLSQRTQSISAFKGPFHLTAFNSNLDDVIPPAFGPKYSSRSLPHAFRPRSSRLRIPTFECTDSEDGDDSELEQDSEEELNFDIPKTRSGGSRYHSRSSRRRYETATEPLQDDDLEFPDTARVARLRREEKGKQRASSASLRKAKGKEKMPGIYDRKLGLDDPSNYADIES
ncbi:hypothetical protein F5Y06DRAFT_261562 [Hypoxylon sp. FL0890]|nr:hypothetical protein F5Y06DRAFT_261562 [Hypoxylon sp. FL0890]